MLDTLIQYESDLIKTSEDEVSMTEIQRKQNVRSGLCCISDKAFHFFQELDKVIRKLETVENVTLYGKSFYDFITSRVLLNETLNQQWSQIFNTEDDEYFAVHVHKLKEEIVSKYVLMSSAQFRREFKQKVKARKEEAHKKQIQMRRDSKVKSSEAQVSSSSQQSQLSKDRSDYSSTSEQQESLHKLVKRKAVKKKTGKGKGKRSKKTKWPCGRCQEDCVVDSVCCDMCDTWHHYECIGLLGDEQEL
ncbi:hypothetical protein ACJMK2_005175 [Sinanodonta woodiana]|uniref:Zinc finger PHD-type domain-containing protein n=1 Tax=Sinanodonta woodiana TaxID=1069815 RepID=A0ABD3VQT8_SINWO